MKWWRGLGFGRSGAAQRNSVLGPRHRMSKKAETRLRKWRPPTLLHLHLPNTTFSPRNPHHPPYSSCSPTKKRLIAGPSGAASGRGRPCQKQQLRPAPSTSSTLPAQLQLQARLVSRAFFIGRSPPLPIQWIKVRVPVAWWAPIPAALTGAKKLHTNPRQAPPS